MLKRRRMLVLGCLGSVWKAICHEIEEFSKIELQMLPLSYACNHTCTHPYNSKSPCSQKSSSQNSLIARMLGSCQWTYLACLFYKEVHLKEKGVVGEGWLFNNPEIKLTCLTIKLCAGVDTIEIILTFVTTTCGCAWQKQNQENTSLTSQIHS